MAKIISECLTVSKNTMEELVRLLHERVLEAGTLAKGWAGSALRETKEHWVAETGTDLSAVVTRVDRFIQDYLGTAIKHLDSAIDVLGEESDGLVRTVRVAGNLCVIIDPIDGTEFFTKGKLDQYSILATIWDGSEVVWGIGLFPSTGELIIANARGAYQNTLSKQCTDHVVGKSLMAHYRFLQNEFEDECLKVKQNGWNILSNGSGFGTNLGAVRLYNSGDCDAFIGPKMAVVDAWPTAHFLKSLGAHVQFFEPSSKPWRRCQPWEIKDFGGRIGPRSRFIAARSSELLQELESLMNDPNG